MTHVWLPPAHGGSAGSPPPAQPVPARSAAVKEPLPPCLTPVVLPRVPVPSGGWTSSSVRLSPLRALWVGNEEAAPAPGPGAKVGARSGWCLAPSPPSSTVPSRQPGGGVLSEAGVSNTRNLTATRTVPSVTGLGEDISEFVPGSGLQRKLSLSEPLLWMWMHRRSRRSLPTCHLPEDGVLHRGVAIVAEPGGADAEVRAGRALSCSVSASWSAAPWCATLWVTWG